MSRPLVRAVQAFAAVLIGVLPGFFIVFNAVFTDATSIWQHLISFLLIIAVYGVLGCILGYAMPEGRKALAIALALPGVAFLTLYTFHEYENILLHVFVFLLTGASAYVGAELGASIKIHKKILS